jgi:methylmalonyl-CoA/ethylmalonyl-CoA epimerase
MLRNINHIGIACYNLEETEAFYIEMFGLTLAGHEKSEEYGLVEAMLTVGDGGSMPSYIQLLQPLAADSPVGRFLARRGEGIHHIGYAVDDIKVALAELSKAGIELIDKRPRQDRWGAQ